MPRSLTTLLAIDARLTAAIARAERARPRHAHQPKRHRVEGQIVSQIALPRFLVWHSYLMSRKPTRASMERAYHRMRGIALLRYAQWAEAHGKPLPTAHDVPDWALHPRQRRHERARWPIGDTGDENIKAGTEKEGMNPDEMPDVPDDVAAWWDEMGWDDGLPPGAWADPTPEQRKQWQDEALATVSADLDFQDWIAGTVLNDLQVLQLLESYWNGQATLFAGQETLGEMGIAGDFNLVDPYAMDFLRYQAGMQVTRIDENTRQQLADALWSGWGGEAEEGVGPFGIPQLARYVQGVMQNWENGLSDMSYNRALMIAQTEVARAETFGQFIAMLGSGVQQKQWMTTAGACKICADQELNSPIAIRDQFPNGLMAPPGHPRCFPAGTMITGAPVTAAARYWYEGSLCAITLANGDVVEATPNHPVWTRDGWEPIARLQVGDEVGCYVYNGSTGLCYDRIEDVVDGIFEEVPPVHVPLAADAFHGDVQEHATALISRVAPPGEDWLPDSGNYKPTYIAITNATSRPFAGYVYSVETETGCHLAESLWVKNCRCSLSPWVDETKPFDPNQWAWAPDPAQMQRLFQDPSFAAWPQYVANLNDPALQMVPPPPTALGDFGKLQYSDLPPALQQVIDPQAFANNYRDAWNLILQGVGQAVNQAAKVDASFKADEQQAQFGGPSGGKVLTLDDILADETPEDLADAAAQIRSTLDDAAANLPDLLANLDDGGGDAGE